MPSYYSLSAKEVLSKVESSPSGLSSAEARQRLNIHGHNKLREAPRPSPIIIFALQFKSPIVWVLLVAMAIALVVGETLDVAVIAIIVVLNAILGFVQEYRAERAIDALRKMVTQKAVVLRDGVLKEISSEEVVPGDILVFEPGMRVPADAYLIEEVELKVQESALTGESLPEAKRLGALNDGIPIADQKNMVFAGTDVVAGHGKAVVVETGMRTEFGRIAHLLSEEKESETPLQKQLRRLSVLIGSVVGVIAVAVFIIGVVKGGDASVWLLTALALSVAAIPEGLPAVVTVGLSLGVQRMAKKNALIRHLPSAETLGACTVICSDKTGTLTKNEMTVRKLFVNNTVVEVSGAGYAPEGSFSHDAKSFELLLRVGALNGTSQVRKENGGWKVVGDPTEAALIVSAKKAGMDVESLHEKFPKIDEIPFSSERKRMVTVHKSGPKQAFICVKGAPETIINLCQQSLVDGRVRRFSKTEKDAVVERTASFAKKGLRVLAFAYKESPMGAKKEYERDLVFVGLQAMIDPARPEVKEAVAKCKTAGIKVVMITGDNALTAEAIARDVGIEGKVVSAFDLARPSWREDVDSIGVYARVNPEDKLNIIEALKKKGHVVAMTGDGVNDAPALKRADLGVAMGIAGTDVAKEAGAMVLADDNFASIVRAVEEGRRIFDNIEKYVAYLFSGNVAEVLIIVSSILLGLPLPLIAIQILWVNLVTDGIPALALSAEPLEGDVMRRPPRKQGKGILSDVGAYVVVLPLLIAVSVLWLFDSFLAGGVEKAQTIVFSSLVFFELFAAVSCRSVREPIFKIGVFRNKWLWLAVASSLALQVAIVNVPLLQRLFHVTALSMNEWLLIAGVAFVGFLYLEVHKLVRGSK